MLKEGHKGGSMRFLMRAPLLAVLALVSTSLACAKVGQLQAQKAFKDGNQAYQAQDYKRAAADYEEAVQANPDLGVAYFFLGNSYDNLWKPSKRGDAANDQLLDKAVTNYEKCADKLATTQDPAEKNIRTRALQYLVAAYGADKLNDPAKAEPVVIKMIQLDPSDPGNYFALAKIYEDAAAYPEAEQVLERAKQAQPNNPAVYMQLAGYYNRMGQFDKTIEALQERSEKEPNNPEAFYTIATYYWDEAYRDPRLKDADKKEYVMKGVEAVDKALQIKPDYAEALVYKGLLLRLQANLEKDPGKQQALIKEADQLRDKAQELRKQKTAGTD
jgi:tetratricopeptide (TPR) repeat protein